MDTADETDDDLAELKELRAGLRAFGRKLALHVQEMDMPLTPLDAERTARMVRSTDLMLIQIYAPPPPPPRPREAARSGESTRGGYNRGGRTYDEFEGLTEDSVAGDVAVWKDMLQRKLTELVRRERENAAREAGPAPEPAQPQDFIATFAADEPDEDDIGPDIDAPDTGRDPGRPPPATGPSIRDPFAPRFPP